MSKEPLYPRVLRLRHIHPSGWQRLVFWEGSFVVAALLVLADVASAWTLLALPAAVALVVKANDLLAGLIRTSGGAPEPPLVAPLTATATATGNVRTVAPPRLPRFDDLPESPEVAGLDDGVREDFGVVTEMGLGFARTLLERQGGFLPFATVVRVDGRRAATAVELDDDMDDPDPADVLDQLHRDLRADREELRAVAVLADAQPAPGEEGEPSGDLVLVELGHTDGRSLLLLAPYSLTDGIVYFGPVSSLVSGSGVWAEEQVPLSQ
ncbi:MAG: hypothetical protein QOE64_2749 [Frankiales bacterium]|jgi:hypothetical protein|nr:hypothetical protein [Frankiales bacterium]